MLLFVDIRRGGGSSQTEIANEENSSENDQKSGESDKNVDNSGDLSTSGGSGTSGSSECGDVNSTSVSGYWYDYTEEFTISSSGTNEISTAGQLAYLAYMVNSGNHYLSYIFQLTADLDLSAHYWIPIGGHNTTGTTASTSYYFSGEFDGNGHTISGIDTSYADTSSSIYRYMGLFGVGFDSSYKTNLIHDVGIEDSTIIGYNYVGAIMGYMQYMSIYNCYSTSSISGYYYVGGIAGGTDTYYSKISDCYNSGSVTGTNYVGGIVGYYLASATYNCYNLASVTGSRYVGGIIGDKGINNAEMYNCFNLGSVSGSSYTGGIIGFLDTIEAAFSIEEELISSQSTSGLYKNYYGGECSQIGGVEGADSTDSAEYLSDIVTLAKTESWYSDTSYWNSSYAWDFDSTWMISSKYNDGYPVLINNLPLSTANDLGVYSELVDEDGNAIDYWISDKTYYSSSWSGAGTESNPYLIQSAGDLALLSYTYFVGNKDLVAGCYFLQTADIDLSAHYWMPIGGHSVDGSNSGNFTTFDHVFCGFYDGANHTISGLRTFYDENISYKGEDGNMYYFCRQGLFGAIRYSSSDETNEISNIILANSTISGAVYCGGICGWANYTIFSNCYVMSDVKIVIGDAYAGGIVGAIGGNTGYIDGCVNEATVVSYGTHGDSCGIAGIVGLVYTSVNVTNCYNSGDIYGETEIGGIVGYLRKANICNCYNTGAISASYSSVGGVLGCDGTQSGETSEIANCFNLGEVTGLLNVGAIIGDYGEISFSHNYYGGQCSQIGGMNGSDVAGEAEYVAALSMLARCESWLTDEDVWDADYAWDFDSVWAISDDVNNAYPYLLAFGDYGSGGGVKYDATAGYWFYEDGMLPQSVVEDADLIADLESYATKNGETFVLDSETYSVWMLDGERYVKAASDGSNVTSATDSGTWFLVEPIVWIVAYGADYPSEEVATAVSAKVVTLGSYAASSVYDLTFRSLFTSTSENAVGAVYAGNLSYSVVDSVVYDAFNTTASQTAVFSVNLDNVTSTSGNTTVTSAGYRVASVNEIDALGGAYATECSDFVAFLVSGGSSASGYVVDYWTRDLAYELGDDSNYGASSFDGIYRNGVYVTEDGVITNASLKNVYGARLSVSL